MAETPCLRCEQIKGIYSRGNCQSCYQFWRLKVSGGVYTWSQLVALGWVTESTGRGRPCKSDVEILRGNMTKPLSFDQTLSECVTPGCGWKETSEENALVHRKAFPTHQMRAVDITILQEVQAIGKLIQSEEVK